MCQIGKLFFPSLERGHCSRKVVIKSDLQHFWLTLQAQRTSTVRLATLLQTDRRIRSQSMCIRPQ